MADEESPTKDMS